MLEISIDKEISWGSKGFNAFTTGNLFLVTLLGICIGRRLGALKGLRSPVIPKLLQPEK